jgi:membrane-associated phospholipid phosphatase
MALDLPRPFMRGLSPLYIPHGQRPGLPSTHASVMFTLAFMMIFRRASVGPGTALLVVALLTSWARIYLGIHFPADIAAAAVLAALACAVCAGLRNHGKGARRARPDR